MDGGSRGRRAVARVSDPVRGAYHGGAQAWAADASLAYVPLARHLVARLGGDLPGPRALDAGAGTGAAGDELRRLGASVVSVDLEPDMLAYHLAQRGPAVAADVAQLPLRSGSFDVVASAFVLNHVPDAPGTLRELGRVTRPGGTILASVFGNERSAAKEAVDETFLRFGWTPPDWYAAVRERAETIGTPDALAAAARRAGLADVEVWCEPVDVGLDTPELVVRYRLGLAHARAFLDRMDDDARSAFVREAADAVDATGEPFRPEVLELVARVS